MNCQTEFYIVDARMQTLSSLKMIFSVPVLTFVPLDTFSAV